jgi:hypothetical protein
VENEDYLEIESEEQADDPNNSEDEMALLAGDYDLEVIPSEFEMSEHDSD